MKQEHHPISRLLPLLVIAVVLLISRESRCEGPIDKEAMARSQLLLRSPNIGVQDVRPGSANIEYVITTAGSTPGSFTIGTLDGDPRITSDNNKKLLFGHPNPWSTDTMIEVDGSSSLIHAGTLGTIVQDGARASLDFTVAPNITVNQELAVINSQGTSVPASMRIHYRVTNNDGASHDIRLRIQLDTMLGDNDGAPFRLPDFAPVVADREFDNFSASSLVPEIPPTALVFDHLDNPQIAAEFNFKPAGFPVPSRVVFGSWGTSYKDWDYTVNSSSFSDSSVIIWWGYQGAGYGDSYSLAPGESVEFALDYGIGSSCSFLSGAPFSMILCAPFQLDGSVVGNTFQYLPDPAKVTSFLLNTASRTIDGARATLNLTPGLRFAVGNLATRPIESSPGSDQILAAESTQVDWNLQTDARLLGPRFYSLVIDAAGEKRFIARAVAIAPIPNAVYGVATDSAGRPISGGLITIYRGESVVGSVTTQADGSYAVGGLEPGSYRVKLSVAGMPDSFFTAVAAAPGEVGVTGNPTAFDSAEGFQMRAYPNPVRDGPVHIAFTTEGSASGEVRISDAAGRPIKSIAVDAPGAGWHEVEWDVSGADAANGVYLYQVDLGGKPKVGRFAVVRRRL